MVRTSTTPFCVERLRAVDFEAGGSFFGCVFFQKDGGVRKANELPHRGDFLSRCWVRCLVLYFCDYFLDFGRDSSEIGRRFDVSGGFDVIGRA